MSSPSNYPDSVSGADIEEHYGDAPVVTCCWCGAEIEGEDGDSCDECELDEGDVDA